MKVTWLKIADVKTGETVISPCLNFGEVKDKIIKETNKEPTTAQVMAKINKMLNDIEQR